MTALSLFRRRRLPLAGPLPWAAALLAVITLCGTAPAAEELSGTTAAALVRVYDVSSVIPDPNDEMQWVRMIPFDLRREGGDEFDHDWYETDSGLDLYAQMIHELAGDDGFTRDDEFVDVIDERHLVVSASEAVHATVEQMFAGLRAATHRPVQLEVELYAVDDLVGLSGPDEVDDLLSNGSARLLHRRTEDMLVGRTRLDKAEMLHSVVRDWSSEIANTGTAGDPELEDWNVGSVWVLRVEDAGRNGGYRVRYLQRLTEILDWDQRSSEDTSTVALELNLVDRPGTGLLDQPHLGVSTVAGSRVAAVGDAFVTTARMETAHGPVGLITRYRLVSAEPPPAPRGGALKLDVIDTSAVFWPPIEAPAVSARALYPGIHDDAALHPIGFPSSGWEEDPFVQVLHEIVYERDGPGFIATRGAWAVVAADEAALAASRAALAARLLDVRSLSLEISVEERGQRPDEHVVLGRVQLSLESSGSALALVGSAGLSVRDYEVDVAQRASSPDPLVTGFFDGLSVRAVGRGHDGVQLELLLNRLLDAEVVDLEAATVGAIDRLTFERFGVTRHVPADGRVHRFSGLFPAMSAERSLDVLVRVSAP